MKIKLEISELVASCLQRMIVYEIDNQELWLQEELDNDRAALLGETRKRIINEMIKLANDLKKQGIHKYIKCR